MTGPAAAKGLPNVTGVRTSDGEELAADLVIDVMGRKSSLPGWLAELGAMPMTEEAEDSGFSYYTRYFRSAWHRPSVHYRAADAVRLLLAARPAR